VKKLSFLTVSVALAFVLGGLASAQTTTTGNNDAGITTRTTRPQTTPTPVSRVRPLSQEDQQRQRESSERRRQSAASGDPDVLLDVPNFRLKKSRSKLTICGRTSRSTRVWQIFCS